MKPYLIKVDMKDIVEYADTRYEAVEKAQVLETIYPDVLVAVYQLLTACATPAVKYRDMLQSGRATVPGIYPIPEGHDEVSIGYVESVRAAVRSEQPNKKAMEPK